MPSCLGPSSTKAHWFYLIVGVTRIILGLILTALVFHHILSPPKPDDLDAFFAVISSAVVTIFSIPIWLTLHRLTFSKFTYLGRSLVSIVLPSVLTVAFWLLFFYGLPWGFQFLENR